MPFLDDHDAPWWVRAGLPEPWQDVVLPEVPAELLEVPVVDELPVACGCCVEPEPVLFNFHHSPDAVAERFAGQWALVQQETARMWRAAAAMVSSLGLSQAEFVGDDLALITRLHPRTGLNLALTAEAVCAVPELIALVESAELSSKHAEALLEEAGKWTDSQDMREQVLTLTLARCRAWVDKHGCWPTPGELRKRLRTAALLLDLTAAEKQKSSVFERRGVSLRQSGIGQATLFIEGPEVAVVQMMDCLRARAQALGAVPGETRSWEQRLFDAAHELLIVDAAGGESSVPTIDDHGAPVTIRVRGAEVSLLVPYSVAVGGDLELAEIPGYGPILPSTARELLAQSEYLRRVAVDADTGQVISVDDRIPGPGHSSRIPTPADPGADNDLAPDDQAADNPDEDGPEPGEPDSPEDGPDDPPDAPPGPRLDGLPVLAAGADDDPDANPADAKRDAASPCPAAPPAPHSAALGPQLRALLQRLSSDPVVHRDLRSSSYRVNGRIRRFIERRDRTCTFPGCTVPGHWCDIDHREPWPIGPTSIGNCHCLCRKHHRAKQAYFTVTLDKTTGDTVWTTPDGRTYRRPPPTF